MIAYIRGRLAYTETSAAVLDCGGVGYRILTTGRIIEGLIRNGAGNKADVTFYTHLQIREDEHVLFGFLDKQDLSLFKKLIAVSNVGPKAALAVMNALTAEELIMAVRSGDEKAIAKANGVGTKTAQRIVMECRDSFSGMDFGDLSIGSVSAETDHGVSGSLSEAAEALIALGYSRTEAYRAVRSVEKANTLSTEELLSRALKKL